MIHPTTTLCRTDQGCAHPECVPIGSKSNPRPTIAAACTCSDISRPCECEAKESA